MRQFRFKATLALFVLAFILGFFTQFLFFDNKPIAKEKTIIVQSRELKNQSQKLEVNYQKQIEVLQEQNVSLQQELEISHGLLQEAKQEVRKKENKINEIITPQKGFLKDVLFRPAFPSNNLLAARRDYQRPCFCDSLIKEVGDYIEANHHKDSIYELQLLQFDSLLAGKDLVIETSNTAYDDLKLLFDKSLINQTALQNQNKYLLATNNRQKFKSKMLSGALFILSGFIANSIIRH